MRNMNRLLLIALLLVLCLAGPVRALTTLNDLWFQSWGTCSGQPCLNVKQVQSSGPWTGGGSLNDLFFQAFSTCSGSPCLTVSVSGGGTGTVTNTSGALTANQLVIGNGGNDLKTLGTLGTTTTLLHGNAAGAPTFGGVNLSTDVTGNLPLGNLSTIADRKILGNMSGATAVPAAIDPNALVSTNYFWSQQPGGSLVVGANTVTLTPCPAGINGTNVVHSLYISAGTGTAEVVVITGGTCTSGAASGTITFTAANTHSGAWTIATASNGIQEAMWVAGINGEVYIPAGTHTVRGKLHAPHSQTLSGGGMLATVLSMTGITGRGFEATGLAGDAYFNIRNLRMSYTSNGTSGEAIYLQDEANGTLTNLYIDNSFNGITGQCVNTTFLNVWMTPRNNGYVLSCPSGGSILGASVPIITSGNVSLQAGGLAVLDLTGTIAGLEITGLQGGGGQYGIFVHDGTLAVNEINMVGCDIDGWTTAVISAVYTNASMISSRWVIAGNTFGSGGSPAVGIKFSTTTAGNIRDITISSNTIQCSSASATCLDLQGVKGFQVVGNIVSNAVAGGKAIVLDGTANTDGTIVGNTAGVGANRDDTNPSAYGLFIDAQAHTGIRVAGNYFKGSTADFQNNGTGAAWAVSEWVHAPMHAGVAVASSTFTETNTPVLINSNTSNGGSTPSAPEPVLTLARSGVSAQSFANYFDVKLSRYTNVGTEARTRVDFGVTQANNDATTTNIMSLRGDGAVSIGTTAPNVKFTLSSNAATLPAPTPTGTIAQIANADAASTRVDLDAFAASPALDFRRADGTAASPSALQTDEIIGQFGVFGYGATGYSSTARAAFRANAKQIWTDVNQGTYLSFQVTPNNSTTMAEAFRVDSTGAIITGTLTATAIASNTGAQTGYLCYNTTAPGTITYDPTNTCLVSLEEYKDIQGKIDNGLELVQRLRPFWGKYKEDTPMSDKAVHAMLGAHQVESVDKRLVTYTADGALHGVRYDHLTAVLVSAVQEQQRQIQMLLWLMLGGGLGVAAVLAFTWWRR